MSKEKVNPIVQEKVSPTTQEKINPIPQQKINQTPKQVPGATTSRPPLPPPATLPDLQVNNVFLSKPGQNTPLTVSPLIGDKVDLRCEYANIGEDIPAPSSWSSPYEYSVRVDGNIIATFGGPPMPYGSTNTVYIPYTINKDGIHQLECVLDSTNKISEANENNNTKTVTFNVAVTDSPMPAGPGVNLRITDLSINNDGHVTATVQNFGPSSMAFDAKIRLRRDNVLIKECVWPKTINKTMCAADMLARNVPGADPNICNWGKGDYEIHAEIIPELAEPQVDKSGRNKKGMLNARQDLFAAYFYEDTFNKNIGIVVGNKGACYATPWSYKFYIDGNLKETGPLIGGLMKKNEYAHVLLKNQTFFTDSVKRHSRFKFEVVPQFPEYEQGAGNNVYEVLGLSTSSGIDIAVTDIRFLGETNLGSNYRPDDSYYFRIVPYFKNISTTNLSDGIIRMETFIDNVSTGEQQGYCGLKSGEEIPASNCSPASFGAFPILPAGSHTVRFVVTILDGNIYNNHFVKTMVRP